MILRFLLWATVIAICLAIAVSIQGCATASFDLEWTKIHPASAKPWFYVTVADVDATCRFIGTQSREGHRINGCSQWKPQGCEIYLPTNAPAWLIRHEEQHCEGGIHQ